MLPNKGPRRGRGILLSLCVLVLPPSLLCAAQEVLPIPIPIPISQEERLLRNVQAEATAQALINALDETLQAAVRKSDPWQSRQLSEATTTFLGTLGTALGPILGAIIGPLLTNIGENLSAGTGGAPIFVTSTDTTSTTNGGFPPQHSGPPPQQFGPPPQQFGPPPQQFGPPPQQFGPPPQQFGPPPQQFGPPPQPSGAGQQFGNHIDTAAMVTRPRPPKRPSLSQAFLSAAGASLQHQLFGHGGLFGQGGFLGPVENIRPPPMGGEGFGPINMEASSNFEASAIVPPPQFQGNLPGANAMQMSAGKGGPLLYTEVPDNSYNGGYNYGSPAPNNYEPQPNIPYGPQPTNPSYNKPNNYGSKPTNPSYNKPYGPQPATPSYNKPNNMYGPKPTNPSYYEQASSGGSNYGNKQRPNGYTAAPNNKPNSYGQSPSATEASEYASGSTPSSQYSSYAFPAAPIPQIPDRPVIPTYHLIREDQVASIGPFKNANSKRKFYPAVNPNESEQQPVRPLTPGDRAAAIKFDNE